MNYIENRTNEVKQIHQIYHDNISDLIKTFAEDKEFLRLQAISESPTSNLRDFGMLSYPYSVLDHAIGVALILNHFVDDPKQIAFTLLHYLSSSAFSKATDLLGLEKEKQIYDHIIASDFLFAYCLQNEIPLHDWNHFELYPLIFNQIPRISADNLESILHVAYFTKLCTMEEIQALYDDIAIVPNEDSMPEFAFDTQELGIRFCKMSIEIGKKYRSYEVKMVMQMIADLLSCMIKRDEITEKDLYQYGDRAILEMGMSSSDQKISDGWKKLLRMDKVYTRFTPLEGKYSRRVILPNQYVDPLVRVKGGYKRVSKISEECAQKIDAYLHSDTELYAYVLDFPNLL